MFVCDRFPTISFSRWVNTIKGKMENKLSTQLQVFSLKIEILFNKVDEIKNNIQKIAEKWLQ